MKEGDFLRSMLGCLEGTKPAGARRVGWRSLGCCACQLTLRVLAVPEYGSARLSAICRRSLRPSNPNEARCCSRARPEWKLLHDLGDDASADGLATLADGEAQAF